MKEKQHQLIIKKESHYGTGFFKNLPRGGASLKKSQYLFEEAHRERKEAPTIT